MLGFRVCLVASGVSMSECAVGFGALGSVSPETLRKDVFDQESGEKEKNEEIIRGARAAVELVLLNLKP